MTIISPLVPPSMPPNVEVALQYASRRGWAVLPMHDDLVACLAQRGRGPSRVRRGPSRVMVHFAGKRDSRLQVFFAFDVSLSLSWG